MNRLVLSKGLFKEFDTMPVRVLSWEKDKAVSRKKI